MEKEWGDERGDLCRWALAVKSKGVFNLPVWKENKPLDSAHTYELQVRSKLSLAQCSDAISSHKGAAYESKGG